MENQIQLLDLPNEVLSHIIQFSTIKSKNHLVSTCVRLAKLTLILVTPGHRGQIFIHGCRQGKSHLIQMMLKEKLVNLARHGNHCLQIAVGNQRLEVIKILLPHIDTYLQPLIMAVKYGNLKIATLLLKQIKLNELTKIQDQHLIWAASSNYPKIVKLLLTDGKIEPPPWLNTNSQSVL